MKNIKKNLFIVTAILLILLTNGLAMENISVVKCFPLFRFESITDNVFCESLWNKFKGSFNRIDNKVFLFVNHSTNSEFCDSLMIMITMLGDAFLLSLIVGLILYFYNKKLFKFNFLFFITILILGGVIVQILKYIFDRPRPLQRIEDIKLLSLPLREHGFPSGHTQTIFTGAIYLSKKIKKFTWLFIFIAIIVGVSRMYVGVHFLSDVIGGAIIGICVTEFFCWLFKTYPDENRGLTNKQSS